MISLPQAIEKYMIEKGYEDYKKIRCLTDVEAAKDPETDPFRSMYKARKLLEEILSKVQNEHTNEINQCSRVLEAALSLQLASNCIACEERPSGEKLLQSCIKILCDDPSISMHKDAVSIVISAHMEIGIINSNRYQNAEQALSSLNKVESIYHEYKQAAGMAPLAVDELLRPTEEVFDDAKRNSKFERIFTHTLFYLAQVHKQLGQYDLSASYCQKTLTKQIQDGEYEPSEWAINAAGLSQYFITKNMFQEAKHCLCCANVIVEEVCPTVGESTDSAENDAKLQHKADIARCWVKYYLALMEYSKEKLYNDVCELDMDKQAKAFSQTELCELGNRNSDFDGTFLMSVNLGAGAELIAGQDVVTMEQAKKVFTQCKEYLDVAFAFFKLDGYVTDHVELAQDTSSLYKHLAFFEREPEQKCKMGKRRADVLAAVLQDINPQFYLLLCRQLQFELGEIYSDMVGLKTGIANANSKSHGLGQHAIRKINRLCNSAIKYFNDFFNTLKSVKNDFPERFDKDVERPALLARFYLARLRSKIIPRDQSDKIAQMNLSYQHYKYIVDYVSRNPECQPLMAKEYDICQDMVELLPRSMNGAISEC